VVRFDNIHSGRKKDLYAVMRSSRQSCEDNLALKVPDNINGVTTIEGELQWPT
jgi:hypothetical protein